MTRINVVIDDHLIEKARNLTGLVETNALIRAGLTALIERESARRLARLGGTETGATAPTRRRFKTRKL
jgi:post-segregation antitoxin (ccd killing protein)